MKTANKLYLLIFISSFGFSHPVVKNLDINKFMGRWYVISLIPNWIEEGATNSYDDYKLNEDGSIEIKYRAIKNGKEKFIKQRGIVSKDNSGRWEIEFLKPWIPFYKAPYEVIILDENYKYMVVGYPDNTFGWIMSRATEINNDIYKDILNELEESFGYDKNNFKKVAHDKK